MVNGFVKGPEHVKTVTLKAPLGKRIWSGLGYLIGLGFILGLLFLLGIACYAAWNAVVG